MEYIAQGNELTGRSQRIMRAKRSAWRRSYYWLAMRRRESWVSTAAQKRAPVREGARSFALQTAAWIRGMLYLRFWPLWLILENPVPCLASSTLASFIVRAWELAISYIFAMRGKFSFKLAFACLMTQESRIENRLDQRNPFSHLFCVVQALFGAALIMNI